MVAHLITNRAYLPAIEGWRGLVSLMAVIFYSYTMFAPDFIVPFAYLGSDFFFCISGFILSYRYEVGISTHEVGFRKFVIHRLARLYPLYILSIILFLLVDHFIIAPNLGGTTIVNITLGWELPGQLLAQLTMLGNLGFMAVPWNAPAWSVSVEWLLSLLFFFLVWNLRRVPTLLWLILAGFSLLYLLDYSSRSLNLMFAMEPIFNPTIARGLMSFSIGALICRFHRALPTLAWGWLHLLDLLLVAATVFLISSYSKDFVVGLDYVFVIILFPALLTLSLYKQSWIGRLLALTPFTFLGKISYSTYLLSLPLLYVYQLLPAMQALQLPASANALVYMLFLISASALSFMLIEIPFRLLGWKITSL